MNDGPGRPPKQLRLLGGRPVLAWSLAFFDGLACIDRLCLVTRPELRAALEVSGALRGLAKPLHWADGGARRQDSSRNGVMALPAEIDVVAIHDAVRPFPPAEATEQAVALARETGGAILAIPMTDTVKRADRQRRITATLDRAELWLAQTPQVFQRALLMEALAYCEARGIALTDEASALEAIGRAPVIVPGSLLNLKITTPDDLAHAEAIAARMSRQTR